MEIQSEPQNNLAERFSLRENPTLVLSSLLLSGISFLEWYFLGNEFNAYHKLGNLQESKPPVLEAFGYCLGFLFLLIRICSVVHLLVLMYNVNDKSYFKCIIQFRSDFRIFSVVTTAISAIACVIYSGQAAFWTGKTDILLTLYGDMAVSGLYLYYLY